MILDRVALLVGLFLVPALVLRLGNRFRDQSAGRRRAFWGAILGHSCGLIVTVCAALYPPVWWGEDSLIRDFLVYWSMLIGSVLGILGGRLTRSKAPT